MTFFPRAAVWSFLALAFLGVGATAQESNIHPYLQHNKWGFIDNAGNQVVSAQYAAFGELSEGLIAVSNGKKWGFIDETGKVIIDFQFDNPDGISMINPRFSEGLACVQISAKDGGNRYGFIDKRGKFQILPTYDQAFNFSDGLALVLIGRKYAYIDKSGSVVIDPKNYFVGDGFSEGLATIAIRGESGNDKWGYIDTTGKIAIRPSFEWAGAFHEGRAAVKEKGKYGFIDKKGNVVVRPVYDEVKRFSEGLAAVGISDSPQSPIELLLNGKWGYVDKDGRVAIPLRFSDATDFSEALACVRFEPWTLSSSTSGFIDRSGNVIIAPQFTTCTKYERGLAEVGFSGGSRLIDKTGRIVWSAPPRKCTLR